MHISKISSKHAKANFEAMLVNNFAFSEEAKIFSIIRNFNLVFSKSTYSLPILKLYGG